MYCVGKEQLGTIGNRTHTLSRPDRKSFKVAAREGALCVRLKLRSGLERELWRNWAPL
jgi:hypothetical protein